MAQIDSSSGYAFSSTSCCTPPPRFSVSGKTRRFGARRYLALWLCVGAWCSVGCASTVPSADDSSQLQPELGADSAEQEDVDRQDCEPATDDRMGAGCAEQEAADLTLCAGVTIQTRADLEKIQCCRAIDGDLIFAPTEPLQVAAADLPVLERVSGSILSRSPTQLTEISLPALREVGTEGADNVLEFTFDRSNLKRVWLPRLRVVHGTLGVGALGALTELNLSHLARVDNVFGLTGLPALTKVDLPADVSVGDRVAFDHLCHIRYDELPRTPVSSSDDALFHVIGCCTESSFECTAASCECE